MGKQRVITWKSDTATVTWDQDLCIHVGECTRAKNELFVMGRDPWCSPQVVDDDTVRDVVARCPSGALHARFSDGTVEATAANTITVANDGPLYVGGDLAIDVAPERAPALARRAALCRCGMSKNKPFCDNSHIDASFDDHGAVGEAGKPLESEGGTLVIEVKKDGPLRFTGNMTIRAGSGRMAWQGTATALCRCGLSANKPFCDGSHRKQDWTDES